MSATLNERTSAAPTPGSATATATGVTRLAVREVRDAPFRALVAAGASSAEAKVAAEQVLFTELHRGSGLKELLDELAAGEWTRHGLRCVRDPDGVLRVSGPGNHGALRQGALLADLLVAEAEPGAVVVSDGLTSLSPLLDERLTWAAGATGLWVVASDRSDSGLEVRVASPDGAIGVATYGPGIRGDVGLEPLPRGVSLALSLEGRETLPPAEITWLAAADQRATRAAAAEHGLLVDAAVWAQVTTAARAYLVPEQ